MPHEYPLYYHCIFKCTPEPFLQIGWIICQVWRLQHLSCFSDMTWCGFLLFTLFIQGEENVYPAWVMPMFCLGYSTCSKKGSQTVEGGRKEEHLKVCCLDGGKSLQVDCNENGTSQMLVPGTLCTDADIKNYNFDHLRTYEETVHNRYQMFALHFRAAIAWSLLGCGEFHKLFNLHWPFSWLFATWHLKALQISKRIMCKTLPSLLHSGWKPG